jgi:hypothetical protein
MTQEEINIIRQVRQMLDRRPIDSSLAVVSISRGRVSVSGTIRAMKAQPFVDVKEEVDTVHRQALKIGRGVRDVLWDCRVVITPKKEKHHLDATPAASDATAAKTSAAAANSGPRLPGQHL